MPDGKSMDQGTRSMLRMKVSRPVTIGIVFAACVVTIYFWLSSQQTLPGIVHGDTAGKPQSSQSQPSKTRIYLLGDYEDPSRLWFPPFPYGPSSQPLILTQNEPPRIGRRPRTPLLIPFTRNNDMLLQTVISYIAAGWPREDIIIVDNSGTMDANDRGLLSTDNPFFLDYRTLRTRYRVCILQTPTLLSFSQLQNFFLRISISYKWRYFFWSHMDVAVLSDEKAEPYQSFYNRVLDILRSLDINSLDASDSSSSDKWALKYFSYDWLTLINVAPWRTIGQWDNFIPYYSSDCDAYSRLALHNFTKDNVRAGHIFDLPEAVKDPERKFFPDSADSNARTQLNSPRYESLLTELRGLQDNKPETSRNKWQGSAKGGKGEPWTYHTEGFQKMWWDTASFGRELYRKKWGTDECRLDEHGVSFSDEFHRGIST